jgi:hypothetical protein
MMTAKDSTTKIYKPPQYYQLQEFRGGHSSCIFSRFETGSILTPTKMNNGRDRLWATGWRSGKTVVLHVGLLACRALDLLGARFNLQSTIGEKWVWLDGHYECGIILRFGGGDGGRWNESWCNNVKRRVSICLTSNWHTSDPSSNCLKYYEI